MKWWYYAGSKRKHEEDSPVNSLMETVDTIMVKSPHGIAVQEPKTTAITVKKGTREEYIWNIQELKIEIAKNRPNKTHIKRLLQVYMKLVVKVYANIRCIHFK